jgi:hypothetical protein
MKGLACINILFIFALFIVCVGLATPSFAQDIRITYADTTLPLTDFGSASPGPENTLFQYWAERFDLSTSNGIVDSVDFVMDSIVSDTIYLILFPDTLVTTNIGQLYMPNYFAPNINPFFSASFPTNSFVPHVRVHLSVSRTSVPQEFFMLIGSQYDSADQFRAVVESTMPITAENARAMGLSFSSNNSITEPLDGNFEVNSQKYYGDLDFGITVEAPSSVSSSMSGSNALSVSAYPNPSGSRVTIPYSLPQDEPVSLTITDAAGRETPLLQSQGMDAGQHTFTWDASNFPSGVYLCRLTAGSESVTQRVVVMR